jgi:hypothetical protein
MKRFHGVRAGKAHEYSLILSIGKASGFLSSMVGRNLSGCVTIWRDVQAVGKKLWRSHRLYSQRMRRTQRPEKNNRTPVVIGIDGTWVKLKGKKTAVAIAVDTDGATITIALSNEQHEEELKQFLEKIAHELGIPVSQLAIVTDDLDTYKKVSEEKHLPHQVSLSGAKRNVKRRLKGLVGLIAHPYLEQLTHILDPPQKDAAETILKKLINDPLLWQTREKTPRETYRRLVRDMLRKWMYYTAYLRYPQIPFPTTNNRAEQGFGRSKIRYPLTRGFKSKGGIINYFILTQMVGMKRFADLAKLC